MELVESGGGGVVSASVARDRVRSSSRRGVEKSSWFISKFLTAGSGGRVVGGSTTGGRGGGWWGGGNVES